MILKGYASISHEESGSLINYFDEYIYFTKYKTQIKTFNEIAYTLDFPNDINFSASASISLPEIKAENVVLPEKALLNAYTIELAEIEEIYNEALDVINNAIGLSPNDDNAIRTEGTQVEWASISLSKYTKDVSNGLVIAYNTLDKVKQTLETVNSLIQNVRGLLQIIKQFLSIVEDIGKQFVNFFVTQIERFFKDIKSTGIYMLDMITYHFMDNDDNPIKIESHIGPWWWSSDKQKKTNIFTGKTLETIFSGNWEQMSTQFSALDKRIKGIDSTGKAINPPTSEQIAEELFEEFFSYKTETYNEFIEKICFHFTDPKDVLPTQLKKENNPFSFNLYNDASNSYQGNAFFSGSTVKEHLNNFWNYSPIGIFNGKSGGIKNLRTGVPDFGIDGNLKVIILAMAMPNATEIIKIIWNLFGYQKGADGKYKKDLKNMGIIGKIAIDAINIADQSVAVWNNVMSWGGWTPEIHMNAQKNRGEGSTVWPYWVGITLGNVFGFIWDEVDELLSYVKNFSLSVNKTILDTIDDLLKKIITEINSLIKLVDQINQIIKFINFLLNIPTFGFLQIDVGPETGSVNSTGGTARVVELIRESKGFFKTPQQGLLETRNLIQEHLDSQERTDTMIIPNTYKSLKALNYEYMIWKNRNTILINIYNYIVNNNFYKKSYDLNNESEEENILILKEEMYEDFEILKGYFNELYPSNLDLEPIISVDDTNNVKEQKQIEYVNTNYRPNIYNKFPKSFESNTEIPFEYSIDNIDFILASINNAVTETERNLDILQDDYTKNKAKSEKYLDDILTDQLGAEDDNGYRTGYQDYINAVGDYFDPDQKMAFAGLVFVLGWPSFANAGDYFNIDDFNKNIKDEYDDWKGQFDDIIGNFGKIAGNFSKIWE